MRKRGRKTSSKSDAEWRRKWEPIFRAAERKELPNRLLAVLETMQCRCAAHKARWIKPEAADTSR